MSTLPDEVSTSQPHPRAVPLGRLLIERGLLTEQELIQALLEQNRTGERIGKVLIRLGYVDEPTVAMALASQHGGPLKTEYGFATGFPDVPVEAVADAEPAAPPDEDAAPPEPPAASGEPPAVIYAEEVAKSSGETAPSQIAATFTALQAIQEELDTTHARIAELEQELHGTRTRMADLEGELDDARSRIADLDKELGSARTELDEQRSRTARLQDKIAGSRVAAETAIAALQGLTEAS